MGWPADDIVINVQGDEPLIPVDLIQAFSRFCMDNADFQMGTIAVPLGERAHIHDPNVVKLTVDMQGNAIVFSRSPVPFCRDQALEDWPVAMFLRHVGIYAYRRATLGKLTAVPPCDLERMEKLEQLRALWLGIEIKVMSWDSIPPHGVDTPEDAERVVALLSTGS